MSLLIISSEVPMLLCYQYNFIGDCSKSCMVTKLFLTSTNIQKLQSCTYLKPDKCISVRFPPSCIRESVMVCHILNI